MPYNEVLKDVHPFHTTPKTKKKEYAKEKEVHMSDLVWMGIEVIIILLLVLECWLLWFFAQEHSFFLALLKEHVSDIKQLIKKETKKES